MNLHRLLRTAALLAAVPALQAQDFFDTTATPGALRDRWSLVMGAQAMAVPAYEGSDRFRLLALPVFSGTYDGRYYLGASQIGVGFGGGLHLVRDPSFTWNLGLGVGDRRPESRADLLAGMGDRDASLWMGTSLTWRHEAYRLGLSLAHGLRPEEGNRLGLSLGHTTRLAPRWTLGLGLQAAWSDARNMAYDFGVSPEQAARRATLVAAGDPRLTAAQLGPYAPSAGLRGLGASLSLGYAPALDWHVNLYLRAGSLQGEAKDSPLVAKPTTLMGGVGFARRF